MFVDDIWQLRVCGLPRTAPSRIVALSEQASDNTPAVMMMMMAVVVVLEHAMRNFYNMCVCSYNVYVCACSKIRSSGSERFRPAIEMP